MPTPYFLQRPTGPYVCFLVPEYARDDIGSRFVVRSLGTLRGDAARLAMARPGYTLAKHFDDLRGRISEQGKPPLKVMLRTGTGNECGLSPTMPTNRVRVWVALPRCRKPAF